MLTKTYGGPASALKLIVCFVLFWLAACGGTVATEPPTADVQSAAVPAPCPQIIANGTTGGMVLTTSPGSNGIIPPGKAATWQPSTGGTLSGQCWMLVSASPGTFSNAQKICSQQDNNTCLVYQAQTRTLVTTSFAAAQQFDIGGIGGLWTNTSHSLQIVTPPNSPPPIVVQMASTSLGSQPSIWLTQTPFLVLGEISGGYWSVDGSLRVLSASPTGPFMGGVSQPLSNQTFTSTFTGLGQFGPVETFASTLAPAGQTLAFLSGFSSPILGHQSGTASNSVSQTFVLDQQSFTGVVLDDVNNDCADSPGNGFNTYAHSCGDSADREIVYHVRWQG